MEAIEFPKIKDYKNQVVHILQAKLDGYLTKIYIDGNSQVYGNNDLHVFTKNDKDITDKVKAIPHIKQTLDRVPSDSILFGELHCPGVHATSVVTMLNDADERLQLTVFAAPRIHSLDMSDVEISKINELLHSYGLDTPVTIDLGYVTILSEKYKEELLQEAVEKGWEGWVLKNTHMTGWYKLKPVRTVDAFVIETYVSDSNRYKGGLKCIRFAVWGTDGKIRDLGTAGNGFKLPYRLRFVSKEKMNELLSIDWTKTEEKNFQEHLTIACLAGLINRDSLLNKVCEIAYDSVAAGGKLRFPRFLRWRDDKDKIACTEDQLL